MTKALALTFSNPSLGAFELPIPDVRQSLGGYAKLRIEESKDDNRMILSFLDFFVRDAERRKRRALEFLRAGFCGGAISAGRASAICISKKLLVNRE
jgi:hypothetical protein